jgi:hypothetical protein
MARRAHRVALAAAAALSVAAAPSAARAQGRRPPPPKVTDPNTAEAKRLFDEGANAYGTGNYEEAIKLWKAAYQLSGKPLILDNLANAYEKLGDLRQTREYLARWRDAAPPEELPMLDARIRTLDGRIAREDEIARKAAAEKAARDAQAQAAAAEQQERSWLPGTILASIGGAAVIAGIVVDAVANGKRPPSSACMKSSTGQELCQTSAESGIATSNRMAIAGDVTWIVGAAAVAAGVVLVLVKRQPQRDAGTPYADTPYAAPPPSPPPAAAWVAPTLGGLSLAGRF